MGMGFVANSRSTIEMKLKKSIMRHISEGERTFEQPQNTKQSKKYGKTCIS
jgi:hypothetical protein